jgi:hypothetical protein
MNERIRQITGQVLDEIVPDTWTTLGYDKIKQIQYRTAELIVKECIEVADKNRTGMEIKTNTRLTADAIKKHFGVEE